MSWASPLRVAGRAGSTSRASRGCCRFCVPRSGEVMQPERRSARTFDGDRVRRASLLGATVAAIAASACCLVPAVLALVGMSGVGFAVALEPYRPVFLGVTVVALATGFYFTYRRPRIVEGVACDCERPRPRATRAARVVLWGSTFGIVVLSAYPYLAMGTRDVATGSSAPVAGSVTRWIRIEGMTCEGCTAGIVDALVAIEGGQRRSRRLSRRSGVGHVRSSTRGTRAACPCDRVAGLCGDVRAVASDLIGEPCQRACAHVVAIGDHDVDADRASVLREVPRSTSYVADVTSRRLPMFGCRDQSSTGGTPRLSTLPVPSFESRSLQPVPVTRCSSSTSDSRCAPT
jgi:mercuric ion transport protein